MRPDKQHKPNLTTTNEDYPWIPFGDHPLNLEGYRED